ncbi:MAG: hypothetical protein LBT14_00275 [Treponema sp.]|jgi:hypothetical protein|nr:hypothetical protein [Treponema sp.]
MIITFENKRGGRRTYDAFIVEVSYRYRLTPSEASVFRMRKCGSVGLMYGRYAVPQQWRQEDEVCITDKMAA